MTTRGPRLFLPTSGAGEGEEAEEKSEGGREGKFLGGTGWGLRVLSRKEFQ